MKRVRFATIGCRLNQAEEAAFAGMFAARGWEVLSGDSEACDVLVVHSCAVTRQAERTTLQAMRAAKRGLSPDGRRPYLVVTGCATTALAEGVLRDAGADRIVGKDEYARLCDIAEELVASGVPPTALDEPLSGGVFPSAETERLPMAPLVACPQGVAPFWGADRPSPRPGHVRAMLKVQDGCNFRCAYCIVPFTRGAAISRPFDEAVSAARELARSGAREIVLSGCNLACYDWRGRKLPELIAAICEGVADENASVSLGSVEPGICDEEIVAAFGKYGNLRHFIHLPIQSGDSGVLKRAGRLYDEAAIRKTLGLYRAACDDLYLGGDFITGLPGETEEAFERTCRLVLDYSFDKIHVFPYSPRQGTRALAATDIPSRAVAKARAARLRALCGGDGIMKG